MDDYIPKDDQPHLKAAITEAIGKDRAFQLEHRVKQVDGSIGWVFSRAVPVRDENGNITEWFGSASDVTARKRAERRRDALVGLTSDIQSLSTAEDIAFAASRIIGEILDVSRVGCGSIDPDGASFSILRAWNAPSVPAIEGKLDLRGLDGLARDILAHEVVAISDVTADPRTSAVAQNLLKRHARSFVNVGIVEKSAIVAVFFVNCDHVQTLANSLELDACRGNSAHESATASGGTPRT